MVATLNKYPLALEGAGSSAISSHTYRSIPNDRRGSSLAYVKSCLEFRLASKSRRQAFEQKEWGGGASNLVFLLLLLDDRPKD